MTEGRVRLITGAAGGVGQAVVERLSRDGYRVAAMDINDEALAGAVKRAVTETRAWMVDQTDESAVRSAVGEIEADMGPIDVLVNVTGWTGSTRFDAEDADYWRRVLVIDYEALLYVTHAVLLGMIERKRGKMVFVASDAARVGTSGEAVYAGAKDAVVAFAKSIAREKARHDINVNVVAPGPPETPLLEQTLEENPELIQRMTRIIPFRRMATPEEQAAAISFLASPDSDCITGQTPSVSGGLTMV